MRPRFMNRGSVLGNRVESGKVLCFNEAPIHESGKFPRTAKVLRNALASMRPRFMNRGSTSASARLPGRVTLQ